MQKNSPDMHRNQNQPDYRNNNYQHLLAPQQQRTYAFPRQRPEGHPSLRPLSHARSLEVGFSSGIIPQFSSPQKARRRPPQHPSGLLEAPRRPERPQNSRKMTQNITENLPAFSQKTPKNGRPEVTGHSPNTLMLKNIPSHASESLIHESIVEQLSGRIQPKRLSLSRVDPSAITNEGFGYITLHCWADAQFLLDLDDEIIVKNHKIEFDLPVAPAQMRLKMDELRRRQIYVRGLNKKNGREECLREFFGKFGKIVDIVFGKHFKSQRFLGFATLEFKDYKSVRKILKGADQVKFKLKGKTIVCKRQLLKSEIDQKRGDFGNSKYFGSGNKPPHHSCQASMSLKSSHGASLSNRKLERGRLQEELSGSSEGERTLKKHLNHCNSAYLEDRERNNEYRILQIEEEGSPEQKGCGGVQGQVFSFKSGSFNNVIRKGSHEPTKSGEMGKEDFGSSSQVNSAEVPGGHGEGGQEPAKATCLSSTTSKRRLTTNSPIFKFPPEGLKNDLEGALEALETPDSAVVVRKRVEFAPEGNQQLLSPAPKNAKNGQFQGFRLEEADSYRCIKSLNFSGPSNDRNSVGSVVSMNTPTTGVQGRKRLTNTFSFKNLGSTLSPEKKISYFNPFMGSKNAANFEDFRELKLSTMRKTSDRK